MNNKRLLLFLFITLCITGLACELGFCDGLAISTVLSDGQGDFDPWNNTRWSAWYDANGNLINSFIIDCSVKFASRSTPWDVDLSHILDAIFPGLFILQDDKGIDVHGNGIIIDARTAELRLTTLWGYYNFLFTTSDFNYWRGFYLKQYDGAVIV